MSKREREIEGLKQTLRRALLNDPSPDQDREGCPEATVLAKLALRKLPMDHPAHAHVALCSMCMRDVERVRAQARRNRVVQMVAACFLVAATIGVVAYYQTREAEPSLISATLDLPHRSVLRGAPSVPQTKPEPFSLPKGNIDLTIHLPVGSETGLYQLELARTPDDPNPIELGSVTAVAENGVPTLRLNLNTQNLQAGQYRLRLHPPSRPPIGHVLEIR